MCAFDGFLRLHVDVVPRPAGPVGADLQYAQIERAEAVADRFEMLAEARVAAEEHSVRRAGNLPTTTTAWRCRRAARDPSSA